MGLELIVGPPNSGRAGRILDALAARLADDPVLVVPTMDDAYRFEQDLQAKAGGPALGASIVVFRGLFGEVAQACGAEHPPELSVAQRLAAVRGAVARAKPRLLARSAGRPGFAVALDAAIADIGAAGLDSRSITGNAAESDDEYLKEIARLHAAYVETCEALGRGDQHAVAREAAAALRANPDRWGARPVFIYGFDDLTAMQLELVTALAAAAEVTATVTFEDRQAMSSRATLREELLDRGGKVVVETTSGEYTTSPVLRHLERSFLADEPAAVPPDEGLVLLEAAGERGQAEQIGQEIAALLRDGTAPEDIAVALRDVNRYGRLYESVLGAVGVPVAVEARIPLAATATGRCLLALLQAHFGARGADDVLAFARTPGRMGRGDADWLERSVRRDRLRSAEEALAAAKSMDKPLYGFDSLSTGQTAAELLAAAARLAKRISEYPLHRQAPKPGADWRLELRAGSAAARALAELAELSEHRGGGSPQDAAFEAIAALEAVEVPLWEGPTEGRVRITSPYRVRAAFVSHLFVASLQEGEFPRPERGRGLLSDEQRASLGLPARAEPIADERYLFYVCLSRPTERLYLCWRGVDDEGAAAAPSPFLEDVRELLAPPPPADPEEDDPVTEQLTRRRGLAEPALAPRPEFGARVAVARARAEALPGKLRVAAAREHFAGRSLFSASQLEQFRECSYRWFVSHELDPQPLDLDREALDAGGLVHAVLEALYREPPEDRPRPHAASLQAWQARARELIEELAGEYRLGGEEPAKRAARTRAEIQLTLFLEREAADTSSLMPSPDLLEASFGNPEDQRGALEIGGFSLRGKIDRVDVDGAGRLGLLRDYKTSREVQAGKRLEEEGKLQLQLYTRAMERLWGIEPVGAVYEPLAAKDPRKARGILREPEPGELLDKARYSKSDVLDPAAFDAKLHDAEVLAVELVGRIQDGDLRRDPLGDECPRYCVFAPICRRERARPDPEDDEDDE
jgi:ATP-dependent helicase/DNAse subunit B